MEILRAIIIDDEQKGIDALKILINKFVPEIKIVAESRRPVNALELIENYKPEIIFLDINMPELNGFELLEKLAWKDFNLVFTTAHQEYALRALKNNAVDYLLKPIDHEDLREAIDKIKGQLESSDQSTKFNYAELLNNLHTGARRVIINSRAGVESIDANDIISCESHSNYTTVNLVDGREILSSKSLKEFDLQLCADAQNFMRVHNSFIINLNKVSRYLKTPEEIVMCNDQKVPLAKSRREVFFKWMDI